MRFTQNRTATIAGSTYSVPALRSVLSTWCFIERGTREVGAVSLGPHMRNSGSREAAGEADLTQSVALGWSPAGATSEACAL